MTPEAIRSDDPCFRGHLDNCFSVVIEALGVTGQSETANLANDSKGSPKESARQVTLVVLGELRCSSESSVYGSRCLPMQRLKGQWRACRTDVGGNVMEEWCKGKFIFPDGFHTTCTYQYTKPANKVTYEPHPGQPRGQVLAEAHVHGPGPGLP